MGTQQSQAKFRISTPAEQMVRAEELYFDLQRARWEYYSASLAQERIEQKIENIQNDMYVSGAWETLGKNENQREANFHKEHKEQFEKLRLTRNLKLRARLTLDITLDALGLFKLETNLMQHTDDKTQMLQDLNKDADTILRAYTRTNIYTNPTNPAGNGE